MIDNETLDKVLPVPTLAQAKDETVEQLKAEGFVITNFNPGGVFYTLLMIVLRIWIECRLLLRNVLNSMFISHAEGLWLDLKAADYSKRRKTAQKTQGLVTLTRDGSGDTAIRVPRGQVFKTAKDINGEELRYFSIADVVLQAGSAEVDVLVEAEEQGARYNVPQGQITRALTYIDGIGAITNREGWITQEGSDREDDEAFRARCLRTWAELATRPIADVYRNAAEEVPGVLSAVVEDMHPRGQGTLDVIITGTAGEASAALMEAVQEAINQVIGPCDDVLIRSAGVVTQAVTVTVAVPSSVSAEDAETRVAAAIRELVSIRQGRSLNTLNHADIIYEIKRSVDEVKNVKVTVPAQDMALARDKVIMLGAVTVNIERVQI